jgi:hypothetical protein
MNVTPHDKTEAMTTSLDEETWALPRSWFEEQTDDSASDDGMGERVRFSDRPACGHALPPE